MEHNATVTLRHAALLADVYRPFAGVPAAGVRPALGSTAEGFSVTVTEHVVDVRSAVARSMTVCERVLGRATHATEVVPVDFDTPGSVP